VSAVVDRVACHSRLSRRFRLQQVAQEAVQEPALRVEASPVLLEARDPLLAERPVDVLAR
jgi:hypothetical protein